VNIFLAGSLDNEWRQDVKASILDLRGDVVFFDPTEHLMHDPKHYTQQDLTALVNCDIVFARVEMALRNYAAVAFQLGFAHALGKKIILVNEKNPAGHHNIHQCSDVFADVPGALAALPFMKEFLA
jgi:nucleoside 2-deoxyribosyltransferase